MSKTENPTDDDTRDAQWAPPDGYDWGAGTVQGREILEDDSEASEWWTDAYEIRMRYGIPEFAPETFDYDLYVDHLVHEDPARETQTAGGTSWLRLGERGCGKTTDNLQWSERLMEVNGEKVIWRGSPARSEWLPYKDWATIWLPEWASVDPGWKGGASIDEDDLEEIARTVHYYEDIVDLVEQLVDHPEGTFNVVYPDPAFTGCSELVQETDRISKTLPFVPKWQAMGDESGTPLSHWWFAFVLAAADEKPLEWWSLIFDEAGDLAEEGAEEDDNQTYSKVRLLRSCMADSRRAWLSVFFSAHYEENLHHKFRREFNTWVDMPDGTPNPEKSRVRSHPLGAKTVPMYKDIMSTRPIGTGLMFNQSEFQMYRWKNITVRRIAPDLVNKVLQIELGEPETDGDDIQDGPTLEYDQAIWKRWNRGEEDRLYVKDPGDGYVDIHSGQEVEPLASPRDDLEFGGIRTTEEYHIVEMKPARGADESDQTQDVADEVVVARIPIRKLGLEVDENQGVAP